jgi:hypothetical protein
MSQSDGVIHSHQSLVIVPSNSLFAPSVSQLSYSKVRRYFGITSKKCIGCEQAWQLESDNDTPAHW